MITQLSWPKFPPIWVARLPDAMCPVRFPQAEYSNNHTLDEFARHPRKVPRRYPHKLDRGPPPYEGANHRLHPSHPQTQVQKMNGCLDMGELFTGTSAETILGDEG
jgi:hypothetical protein